MTDFQNQISNISLKGAVKMWETYFKSLNLGDRLVVANLRKKIGVEIQKYPKIENWDRDRIEKSLFFMDDELNWMGFTKFKDGNPDFKNSFFIPVSGFLKIMRKGYLYEAYYMNNSFYHWDFDEVEDLPYFSWGQRDTKDMTPFVFQSVYSKSKPFMNWDETPLEVKS